VSFYVYTLQWPLLLQRENSTKSIKEKYAALKEVEGGSSKSQVAMKYGVPKNTLSTWIKNKERIFSGE